MPVGAKCAGSSGDEQEGRVEMAPNCQHCGVRVSVRDDSHATKLRLILTTLIIMFMTSRRLLLASFALPTTLALLAACGSTDDPSATGEDPQGSEAAITVVTSTNVYGDIVQTIGGEHVDVTSIITSAAQDPHSYEATVQDRVLFEDADLIIKNGGGYDYFMDQIIGVDSPEAVVLDVVEMSGLAAELDEADEEAETQQTAEAETDDHADDDHAHEDSTATETDDDHADHDHAEHDHIEGLNEHLWYRLPTMIDLGHEIATELGEIDPDNASTFTENAEKFEAELTEIIEELHVIADGDVHYHIAITEPVPLYLLEEADLHNVTPEGFSSAIEEGNDVSPAVLQETLNALTEEDVVLLAYNEQTSSPETERVRSDAEAAGITVVDFTETLPEGLNFVEWMQRNATAIVEGLPTS